MSPEKRKRRGGEHLQKREKQSEVRRPRRRKALLVLYIVLTVLATLVVATFIAYRVLVVKPQVPGGSTTPDPAPSESGMVVDATGPKLSGDRKEEFYTFMVVGRDTGGGGNTDTIMVAAYDVPNQRLNVMSIPRDTMVNVPWDVKKINSVYNYAPYYDKDGIAFLREEVSYLIGFQPDYTIVVEWDAVGEIVEAIGGVEFEVPIDMNYDDPTQDLHIHLSAGMQQIDGDKAMQLLRWRKNSKIVNGKVVVYGGYPNGDLGRITTQQAFLKTVVQKCLSSFRDLGTISRLATVFLNSVTTDDNLTLNNLVWFAQKAILGGLSMDNVSFLTLPTRGAYAWSRTYHQKLDYVVPIADEMLKIVNENFNPYLEDLDLSELDIMSVNSDGTLSSTSGRVEDTRATAPPVSSPSPSPEVSTTPEPETTLPAQPTQTPELPVETEPVPPVETDPVPPDETGNEIVPTEPEETLPSTVETPAPTESVSVQPSEAPAETVTGPGMEPIE